MQGKADEREGKPSYSLPEAPGGSVRFLPVSGSGNNIVDPHVTTGPIRGFTTIKVLTVKVSVVVVSFC